MAEEGPFMHTLAGHRRAVRAVAYGPLPAPLLASAGDDQTIRLWDPVTGGAVAALESKRDGLLALAFAPDGSLLASGGRAGSLIVWSVAKAAPDPGLSLAPGPVVGLSFTADGKALLAGLRSQRYGGEPGRLMCWNLEPIHPPESLDWAGDVESVAVAPSRDLLAIAGQYRGVELWEVGRRRQEPVFWMPSRVRSLCFSPGSARLLAAGSGRLIQVWDVQERRLCVECKGHRSDVFCLAFDPTGRTLLSGGGDRSVRLWDVLTGRQLAAWDWQIGAVHGVAFAPDGMTAAAGGDKPTVVVWDVEE
jgi:WD40 repeat protein